MKKLLYLFLLFISLISIKTVFASSIEETITLDKTINFNNLNAIYGYDSNYITIEEIENNSLLTIYNANDEQLVQKQIPNLKNANIIKYNDSFILVGLSGNALKVIAIDSNLIISKQEETTYLINSNYKLDLYTYDNKIYIIQTKSNNLADTKIYEIDEELNIEENNFSSYNTELLKNILKNEYYSLLHNDEEIEDSIYHYIDSTYTSNNNYLVGSNANNAILKIIDNDNQEILHQEYPEYQEFRNIVVINKKILILASKEQESVLLEISSNGEILDELVLTGNNLEMLKTGDKLLIISKEEETTIDVYKYLCDIEVEENVLGTIKVQSSSAPSRKVSVEAIPNAGYVLESITVIDSEDNIIETVNNEFTMPNNNVVVMANYKQTVNNPETMDMILFFVIALVITFFIMNRSYLKYKWLKK